MIEIFRYTKHHKEIWDEFVKNSRIDTFLFFRDFLDYHSDRFEDHSYLIFRKGKLEALLPGNIHNSIFYSHQGLTYGGFVTSTKITLTDISIAFELINKDLNLAGVKEVIYKPTPYIYHLQPAQEDIYALFRLGATKIGCNISSTILQIEKIPFIESRKSGVRKAIKEDVDVSESDEFYVFWEILENNLLRTYGKTPVHSLNEILILKNRFTENIKLYIAKIGETPVAGCLLFLMKRVIHVQYISANEQGKKTGALDLLFDKLINEIYIDYPIFDFGQSTEQMGNILNENLLFQKEGFGGRGIAYDIYSYNIN